MGTDKALLQLAGRTLLARVAEALAEVTEEILVVGREYVPDDLPLVTIPDEVPGGGPLAGLYTGLRHASHPHAVVVGCDHPFLQPRLLTALIELSPSWDAVVPRVSGQEQPLVALYARALSPHIEAALARGHRSMRHLLRTVSVRYVDEAELIRWDPDLQSFLNVNDLDTWNTVRARAEHRLDEVSSNSSLTDGNTTVP